MTYRAANAAFAILILISFSLQANSGRILSQENPQPSKKGSFNVLPYYHSRIRPRIGCPQVEVKAASIGSFPPEVLTFQVVIESFTEKPVTGVSCGGTCMTVLLLVRKPCLPVRRRLSRPIYSCQGRRRSFK